MARPSRARVVETEAVAVEAPAATVEAPAPAVEAPPVEPEELEAPPPAVAPDVLRRRRVALAIAAALTDEELTRAEQWAAGRAAGAAPAAPPRAGAVSGPVILAGIIGAAALFGRGRRRR